MSEYNEITEEIKNTDLTDYTKLLKLARKYSKLADNSTADIRVAFIGSCNIKFIVPVTKMLIAKYGINAETYEGEYDGIKMDIFDDNSEMYRFLPNYLVMLPDARDFKFLPEVLDDNDTVEKLVSSAVSEITAMFEKVHEMLPDCQILCSNIVVPYKHILGNLEANCAFSQTNFFARINSELMLKKPPYVTLVDADALSSYVGKNSWFDESAYNLNKSPFSLKYIGEFCDMIAKQLCAFCGKIKKCLVLDLDNTLWGGVVGDDGYDGIITDPNDALGESYLNFQKYIISLKKRGIILAVCSKNDFDTAKEPFDKNPNMLLKYDDFSCFTANWNDKVSNIKNIASTLDIGIDSLVFFDDNPTERELVKTYLPEVYTVDVPEDPAYYVRALDRAAVFEWSQITKEDIGRSSTYIENRKRDELMISYDDYDAYLKALLLEGKCEVLTPQSSSLNRFTQLMNKTNQFNLRTQRYSEAQVENMAADKNYDLLAISLQDKFSSYGIIACIALKYSGDECFIENWVMSCRVLKKDVEKFTMAKVIALAATRDVKRIVGEYIPTAKNKMVQSLYESFGFKCTESQKGSLPESETYELSDYKNIKIQANVKEI